METLRMQDNYRAPIAVLNRLARRARVMPVFLLKVINDYDLFVVENGRFHSPGMMRRMRPYDAKTAPARCDDSSQGACNLLEISKTIPPNAREEEKKERRKEKEEEKEETPAAPAIFSSHEAAQKESTWEACIDFAFLEQSWVEIQAMHSGMSRVFVERLQEIIDFFKRHVRTYGKEPTICCVNDAKSYFSNFIRPASATQKSLLAELSKQAELSRKNDPYRYETRDPVTGERSYYGEIIPRDAPPRPNENSLWSDVLQEWS